MEPQTSCCLTIKVPPATMYGAVGQVHPQVGSEVALTALPTAGRHLGPIVQLHEGICVPSVLQKVRKGWERKDIKDGGPPPVYYMYYLHPPSWAPPCFVTCRMYIIIYWPANKLLISLPGCNGLLLACRWNSNYPINAVLYLQWRRNINKILYL